MKKKNLYTIILLMVFYCVSMAFPAFSQESDNSITPVVHVPEIRHKLSQPVTVDFRDVDLISILNYLSDSTGVNIVPSANVIKEKPKASIKVQNMALESVLKYLLYSQELDYRVEENAIWVATPSEMEKEDVETRIYFLNVGVGMFTEFADGAGTESSAELGSGGAISKIFTIKDLLEEAVSFTGESKIVLDERTGALIITNTPKNLKTVEDILYNLDITPIQVLIEARFVEISFNPEDEFGGEIKLSDTGTGWGITQNESEGNQTQIDPGSGSNFSVFDNASEGFNFTLRGVLTHPQFEVYLHSLEQSTKTKTLSSPKVSTLNNQTATIQVVDEFIYPTRYEVTLIQFDKNGDGDYDDGGETEYANVPQDFVTQNIGIVLKVTPNVGNDKKSVTLTLSPEVSTLGDFRTFAGDVSLPEFSTKSISTTVAINSGETVVLGGLMDETNEKTVTKVPVLSSIPILGNLFKKDVESVERRNLLVFVTATIMDASGATSNQTRDEAVASAVKLSNSMVSQSEAMHKKEQ